MLSVSKYLKDTAHVYLYLLKVSSPTLEDGHNSEGQKMPTKFNVVLSVLNKIYSLDQSESTK